MNNEEKKENFHQVKSEIPEEAEETTVSERKRHKGKRNKSKNKAREPRAKPEAKNRDMRPFPTRSRTNITKNKHNTEPSILFVKDLPLTSFGPLCLSLSFQSNLRRLRVFDYER